MEKADGMEQVRSFIAIMLPDDFKAKLGQLEAELKSAGHSRVKWVNPDSIHLTLKFLGNISAGRIGEITGAMERTVQGIRPFRLAVKDLGVFPGLKRPRVAWVGISGELEMLGLLQKNIESNLTRLGFTAESRAFTAHLTLARVHNQATPDERQRFGQLIAGTKFEAGIFEVDTINLIQSQLTREGAIYTPISSAILRKDSKES